MSDSPRDHSQKEHGGSNAHEEYALAHCRLDDEGAPRSDASGNIYSLSGRIQQLAKILTRTPSPAETSRPCGCTGDGHDPRCAFHGLPAYREAANMLPAALKSMDVQIKRATAAEATIAELRAKLEEAERLTGAAIRGRDIIDNELQQVRVRLGERKAERDQARAELEELSASHRAQRTMKEDLAAKLAKTEALIASFGDNQPGVGDVLRRDLTKAEARLAKATAALERISGMSERPMCLCGRPTGTLATRSCADTALAALRDEVGS